MSQRAYNAIRRHDRRNVVWYEPNVIFNNGPQTHHGDIGPRSGMSFHIYCLRRGKRRGRARWTRSRRAPASRSRPCRSRTPTRSPRRTGDALILSEFGATDDLGQIERLEDYADRYMVGWLYWHYCECDDPTTAGVGDTQSVVSDARKPPTGSNVKSGKLDVLTRPYPQAVAGVPTPWRFDPDSKRFELAYTTARKGGGSFAFRADTQVFASPRHYPRGYDVRVRGGEAISAPGKRLLRVRTCTGRRRVEVTLTPGGGNFRADCRAPRTDPTKIHVRVRPRRVRAGRRTRFRFRVTVRRGRPLRGALIRFAGRRARTNRRGRASLRVRLGRRGRRRVVVSKRGYRRGRATVRVLRPR